MSHIIQKGSHTDGLIAILVGIAMGFIAARLLG